MKRKDFLKTSAILSLAPIISSAKVFENTSKTDVSQKIALIGIGRRGTDLAINAFLALAPKYSNLYTINGNVRILGENYTHICYDKIYAENYTRIPEEMLQDWEYNQEALKSLFSIKENKIIITSALGGQRGTYLAYMLISKLLEHKSKENITFVTSFPFFFEGPQRKWFSQKYLDKIKALGVNVEVLVLDDLRKEFGEFPFTMAFTYADRRMVEIIGGAIKNLSVDL